jgi:hypothetical protein
MTELELRQKIEQQLAQLPSDQLSLVNDFLSTLEVRKSLTDRSLRRLPPVKRGSKAVDLLEFTGTWQGSDLKECLHFIHKTCSKTHL